jgi:MOSC domain-containing protein YiiM
MDETGRLEALWVKRFKRGPMDPKTSARLVAGRGIEGNANQGGKREVTVILAEDRKRVSDELGRPADPSWRRANVLVSGVDLRESRGKVLRVGPVKISVSGETRPCERMNRPARASGLGARAENRYRDSNGKIRVAPIKMRVASVGTAMQ